MVLGIVNISTVGIVDDIDYGLVDTVILFRSVSWTTPMNDNGAVGIVDDIDE